MELIARRWSGRVRRRDCEAYENYLLDTGIRDYRETSGIVGCQMLRRHIGGLTEFEITTFWADLDSIKTFAGDDYCKARYYPLDRQYLVRLPPEADHFETILMDFGARR